MSSMGFTVLLVIGLAIAAAPHLLVAKRGIPRSLTTWIISMIGVGIAVGACFRYFSIETFSPLPAMTEGSVSGPFDVPAGASFTFDVGRGPRTLTFADEARSMTAAEVVVAINAANTHKDGDDQDPGVRARHMRGKVTITSDQLKGDDAILTLSEGQRGLATLGITPGRYTGVGDSDSMIRDLHAFLKDIFINALKMMIIPVIFFSIITGMLSLGSRGLGRLGLKTVGYYMSTSLLAIIVGLLLVNLIAPGDGAVITLEKKPSGFEETAQQSTSDFLFNFFRNLIPTNIVQAMFQGKILQIIFFALFVGYFINRLADEYRQTLTRFFNGMFEVMLLIVRTLLWLAPAGVYAIFVKIIAETGPEVFIDLGWYALAVLVGLIVHAAVTLPLMLKVIGRVSPWRHFKAMSPALLTAFSTSSSSATLPMTLRCVEERVGVSNRTSSFVLPLGATVNMDGTALYECVAAIFIAQIYITQGVMDPLTFTQQLLVVFTALAASIGAAGVPMAGMVMLGTILHALGMPLEGVGYVLAVDRVLDMCRTTVNVWSDSCGCAMIARTEGESEVLTTWPPKPLT